MARRSLRSQCPVSDINIIYTEFTVNLLRCVAIYVHYEIIPRKTLLSVRSNQGISSVVYHAQYCSKLNLNSRDQVSQTLLHIPLHFVYHVTYVVSCRALKAFVVICEHV